MQRVVVQSASADSPFATSCSRWKHSIPITSQPASAGLQQAGVSRSQKQPTLGMVDSPAVKTRREAGYKQFVNLVSTS